MNGLAIVALAIIFAGEHDMMVGARRGSPLAIGYGEGEMYLGSDALALAPLTKRICYLKEGDWTLITSQGAKIFNDENLWKELRNNLIKLRGSKKWNKVAFNLLNQI